MSRSPHPLRRTAPGLAAALLAGACSGPQSALDPAGREAERIGDLFWWMAGGAAIVWVAVVGLAVYALRIAPRPHSRRTANALIVGGGAVFPTIVLGVLLGYGLWLLPAAAEPGDGATVISVSGEQWWWRVRYERAGHPPVELANELRLAVGERVDLLLESPDVIHSFWVPALAGKMDMIPGRVTRLALEPTRTGRFRGVCAEYCGASHALMAFPVEVVEPDELAAWLAHQASEAAAPATPLAARGRRLFLANGCGACHAVRGTPADGTVGPDLTHVGSRLSLAAASLGNEPPDFVRWLDRTAEVKPGVHMPSYGMLPPEDLAALAAYLDGLR